MIGMYAMQRANGDWFAFSELGKLCVPVFNSNSDAMLARSLNFEMLHFKPIRLDESAVNDLRPTEFEDGATFRIISDPSLSLSRGSSINHAQLTQLSQTV
jgi:hypothetical protein